jgi:hypothetical protein
LPDAIVARLIGAEPGKGPRAGSDRMAEDPAR